MNREIHVRLREGLGVKFPCATGPYSGAGVVESGRGREIKPKPASPAGRACG